MDQTRVQSGYDVELALGERYLTYLLLLASDVGELPGGGTFGDVELRLQQPPAVDRTYEIHPDAPLPDVGSRDDAFGCELLFNDPRDADLKVMLRLHAIRPSTNLDIEGLDLSVFLKLGLDTTRDPDGAIDGVALSLELIDVEGGVVTLAEAQGITTKAEIMAGLAAHLTRTISLDDVAGGRVQDFALRKLAPDGVHPAALGLYLNLVLRAGPQEDNLVAARGDVLAALNIAEADQDLTFATRAGLLGDFGDDSYHRRAVRSGSGYDRPIRDDGERVGHWVRIDAGPSDTGGIKIEAEGEVTVDNFFDPNFTLNISLTETVDDDGVMAWDSGFGFETSILAELVFGVIAVAMGVIFTPLVGYLVFVGLELAKEVTEMIVSEIYDDNVDTKVDAALLDITPGRFTFARKRWDPLFTTHHQIGLRPGGTVVTHSGLAMWGKACLTRAAEPVRGVVIRESVRDGDDEVTALRYRVTDAAGHAETLSTAAAATCRGQWVQHDPAGEPDLFTVDAEEAIARVERREIRPTHPYLVKAVEGDENQIEHLLVISEQEQNAERRALLGTRTEALAAEITAAEEAAIRAQVLADFANAGVVPTQEQVDTAVATRLQALIDEAVAAYVENELPADLDAAIDPLLRLEMQPTQFGRFQDAGLLKLAEYDLIELRAQERWYYRDRYDHATEKPPAKKEADNLPGKRRYRSTPTGPVFL